MTMSSTRGNIRLTVAIEFSASSIKLLAVRSGQDGSKTVVKREESAFVAPLDAVGIIQKFLKSLELDQKPADGKKFELVWSIPRHWLMTRILQLPSTDFFELKEMAKLQAIAELPFPEDEILWDVRVLNQSDGHSTVFLAIARQSLLEPFWPVFETLNLWPVAFCVSSFSLEEYARTVCGLALSSYWHLHRAIGGLEVTLFHKKNLIATHCFPGPVWPALDKTVQQCKAILRSNPAVPSAELQAALLSGRGWTDNQDPPDFMGVPIEKIFQKTGDADGDWATIHGAALTSVEKRFNLLPDHVKSRHAREKRRKALSGVFLWSGAWLAILLTAFAWSYACKKMEIDALNAQIKALKPDAQYVETLLRKSEFLRSEMNVTALPLEILRELHAMTPEGIVYSAFSFNGNEPLQLQGTAQKLGDVMDLLGKMEKSRVFSRAELKNSSSRVSQDRELVDFQLQAWAGGGRHVQ